MNLSLATLFLCSFLFSGSAVAQQSDVRAWTVTFLESYVKGDSDTVVRSVDDNTTVYGSDAAEAFHGRDGIKSMLANDARLWAGRAHIGEVKDVSISQGGDLQTIFFNASVAVGDQPPVPVRFCMVWRKSTRGWYLVQSSNSVVTEGQSAQAILTRNVR